MKSDSSARGKRKRPTNNHEPVVSKHSPKHHRRHKRCSRFSSGYMYPNRSLNIPVRVRTSLVQSFIIHGVGTLGDWNDRK